MDKRCTNCIENIFIIIVRLSDVVLRRCAVTHSQTTLKQKELVLVEHAQDIHPLYPGGEVGLPGEAAQAVRHAWRQARQASGQRVHEVGGAAGLVHQLHAQPRRVPRAVPHQRTLEHSTEPASVYGLM